MVSQQLKDMTSVLEEFDAKYTRKEDQLKEAREENQILNNQLEQLKRLHENALDDFEQREIEHRNMRENTEQDLIA